MKRMIRKARPLLFMKPFNVPNQRAKRPLPLNVQHMARREWPEPYCHRSWAGWSLEAMILIPRLS